MTQTSSLLNPGHHPPRRRAAPPRLLVVDLDGTLLGGQHTPYARIPDHVARFLDQLANQGCHWAINSTWDVQGQWELVLNSAVASRPKFFVGELGSSVARCGKKGPEPIQPYTDQQRGRIQNDAKQYLLPMLKHLIKEHEPKRMAYYGHAFEFEATEGFDRLTQLIAPYQNDTEKLSMHIKDQKLFVWLSLLSKGEGLVEVLRTGGYMPADIVVAGDEISDIPMMDAACSKYAICPANAAPAVKQRVRSIHGEVASQSFGSGVIDAFRLLAIRNGWASLITR